MYQCIQYPERETSEKPELLVRNEARIGLIPQPIGIRDNFKNPITKSLSKKSVLQKLVIVGLWLTSSVLCGTTYAQNSGTGLSSDVSDAVNNAEQQTISVPEGNVTELIDAIKAANNNPEASTIITVSGTYRLSPDADPRIPFEHDGDNGLPSINAPITIIGEKALIKRDSDLFHNSDPCNSDDSDRFRIFHISGNGHLTLENIDAVKFGCPQGSGDERRGGAIISIEGKVTLINSEVLNNEAHRGGAMYNDGGEVVVNNSTFSGNVARASSMAGGGIHNTNDGIVDIHSGSLFSNNRATSSRGGGGGIASETGIVELTNSTFSDNVSGGSGGGIRKSGSGVINIHHSMFSDNISDGDGGGINNSGSSHMIIFNSTFSNNEADSDGGGLINTSSGDVTLFNNVISGNSAGEIGGGIYITGSGDNEIGKSTISNNSAGEFGGGVANRRNLTISNSLLLENIAEDGGGGIDNDDGGDGLLRIVNSTIRENSTGGNGGAVRNTEESLSRLSFTTIDNNIADDHGGGIWNDGVFEIKNAIVTNSAGADCHNEGAINAVGENIDSDETCPGFTQGGIDPLLDPGGLENHGGPTLTIALVEGSPAINAANECTDLDGVLLAFDQREVSRPQGLACDIGAYEYDDEVFVVDGDVTQLIDLILDANAHPDEPAVIEISGIYTLSPAEDERIPFDHNGNTGLPAITSDITIKGNEAAIRRDPGLGCSVEGMIQDGEFRIFYVSDDGNLGLENIQAVSHGCADGSDIERNGGAIYNEGGAVSLANVSLLNNNAHNGGDIYTDGGEVFVRSTTFSGSEAINNGGGIYSTGHVVVEIDESTFAGVTASRGAGIYGTDGMWTITGSTFENNLVSSPFRDGGGINSTGGTWNVSHSTFSGNEAGSSNGHGGGILADGSWTITESTFSNNTAGSDGGGIRKSGSSAMEIIETDFTENAAGRHGGGFSTQDNGEVTISNGKFTHNTAALNGGAIDGQNRQVRMEIVNSIFTDNSADGHGGGIASRGEIIVSRSTITNNRTQEGGGGGIDNASNGNLTVINSTFWSNNANSEGGAILNGDEGSATIIASTIAGNSAMKGGGISNEDDASISIKNSIVAESLSGDDCNPGGMFHAEGENISSDTSCPEFSQTGTDPLLDAAGLQDYGGPSPTLAFMSGSPATDAVTDCTDHEGNPLDTDQRGVNRPQGTACDIGAFESEQLDQGELVIHPDVGGNQGVFTTTIFGTWFDEGYTVKLVSDSHPDIHGNVTDVRDDRTRMSVRFDLSGQPLGKWDIVVTDNQGVPTTLPDAFTIEEGDLPEVWAMTHGAHSITGGQQSNVNISYGNRGDTDIHDVMLFIHVPGDVTIEVNHNDIIIPDVGDLDGSEDPYFEVNGENVLPLWIYKLPAQSTASLRLTITPVDPPVGHAWLDFYPEPIRAEIGALPLTNEFARTGDFESADPSMLFQFLNMVFTEAYKDLDDLSKNVMDSADPGITQTDSGPCEYEEMTLPEQAIHDRRELANNFDEVTPSGNEVTIGFAVGLGAAAICATTPVGWVGCGVAATVSGALAIGTLHGAISRADDLAENEGNCERSYSDEHGPNVCPSDPEPDDPYCSDGARTFGHPHFMTFDRLDYDFQAVGEFILTRSTKDDMEIQVRLEEFGFDNVTVVTAAAMNVNGDKVVFEENSESPENVTTLFINGIQRDLPGVADGPISLSNGGTITRSGRTFIVHWQDGETRVDVRQSATGMGILVEPMIPPIYRNNLEGLLGTADGNPETDFTTQDGTVLIPPLSFDELYRDFGDSWRITQEESLFGTDTFEDLAVPAIHITTEDLDPEAVQEAAEICKSHGIADPILIDNCIFDVVVTGEELFAEDTSELITPGAIGQVDEWMDHDDSKLQIVLDVTNGDRQEFSFTGSGDIGEFKLSIDEESNELLHTEAFHSITPGTYEISQKLTDDPNWSLENIYCDSEDDISIDVESGNVTIDIGEGDVIRCMFTNQKLTTSGNDFDTNPPESYSLSQNYPNPFNPATTIRFALPEAVDVKLVVYDILGRRVKTILDGHTEAGFHKVVFDASHLSSGVYIYQIRAGDFVETYQMTLVK